MRVYISLKNKVILMTPVEIFQSNLIKRRKEKGLSQVALAQKVGISRRAMCYYEKSSTSFPSSEMLLKIANALSCKPEELLAKEIETPLDGRTLEAKLMKKFKAAAELPETDRKILVQLLDSLLEKNKLISNSK